ncbi:hypothetical protein EAX62_04990 [Tessaracoccus antarcticus]|uniref:Histidine kinase/HSP90-like ATPase domain-containing protein n=1 Tax=Tessaracoccus antarcticus TaxID=2479848 RepID=A0A3M0GBZ9_9ACTN|nr:hypothetical protein EAX62_04990 [Tessaracoccus antarcticus]
MGASQQASPAAMGRQLVGYGVALLSVLGIVVAGGDVMNPLYPPLMRLGVGLCLAAQALIVVECLRPSRLAWVITAAATLGIVFITVGLLMAPPFPGLEWRTNIWLGPVFQFLILLHPRPRRWPWLAALSLGCWATVTVVHHLDWRIQVLDLVFTITPILTFAIGLACLTNLLLELRLSQMRRIHGEQETRRAEMLEAERRARIRLAHDSLLHTLQHIFRDWARPTPAEARELAAGAVADLRASSQSLDRHGWVSLRAELQPALTQEGCVVEFSGRDVQVPAHVGEAVVGAAREAIRNVVKHARGHAMVTVARFGSGCRVTVADDGPGFDPHAPPGGRLGVTEGILRRMEEAGGHAEITSGQFGSTVKLEWMTEPFGRPEPFGPMARTMISWLPLPVLAASLIHVLVFDVGPSALGVTLIWLLTAAVSALGMRQLRRAGLKSWQPVALTVLAIVLVAANYAWIPREGTNGYDVWTPSLAGALMVLALPGRRLREAVALAATVIVSTVASCVIFLGWQTVVGSQLGSIMAVVMYVLAPLALATGASILATHAARTEELHAAQRLSTDLAAERDATRLEWVNSMRRLAEPFLLDVASGAVVSTDETAVKRARLLEARMRDELAMWPNGSGITDRAHALREHGWDCTLDVRGVGPAERRNLLTVMSQLPEPMPGQRVHLTHRQGRAVATVTDPSFSMEQWHQLADDVDAVNDEDFTQLRTPAASVASLVEGSTQT